MECDLTPPCLLLNVYQLSKQNVQKAKTLNYLNVVCHMELMAETLHCNRCDQL